MMCARTRLLSERMLKCCKGVEDVLDVWRVSTADMQQILARAFQCVWFPRR
jgi:molybdenum cofactor biosynthesis enzyme MoaA